MSVGVERISRIGTHRSMTVSFGSPLDAKELVRQAIDIVDLVGRSIQLRRQGRIYVGLCPWHEDSRPSLQVNPERQSWKCWVCDVGGDIFSFVMKMEGVSFPEALQMLADQAGIAVKPAQSSNAGRGEVSRSPADKRSLYQAMAWAESQYHECFLHSPEAQSARQYIQERGISADNVAKFHLGFSPEGRDWLLGRLRGSQFDAKMLEAVGILARPASGGSLYDRFRGRVLFSIRDPQGRPVGLGGRLLPGSSITSPAKYVNSPETPLFSKSSLLYGLDVAREAMRKSHTALVMEGYTDCIAAHQYGFQDAVAVLGTALGPRHIQILKRFCDRIVLVLDGDEAGQRRTNEVLELFVAEKVDLRILTLPDDLDPCEFLQERGAEAFADLLANRTVDALEHAFRTVTRGIDLVNDIHAGSQALERLVSIVAKAPRLRADTTREDRFREEKILQRLAASFRVPEKDVRDRLTALRREPQRRPSPASDPRSGPAPAATKAAGQPAGKIDPWQQELLEILIRHPACVPLAVAQIQPEQLAFEPCRRVYEACCRLSDLGEAPTFERLMLEFDDPAIKSLLVELDESGQAKAAAEPEALLQELIRSFQRLKVAQERPLARGAFQQGGLDERAELDLLAELIQKERARHGISAPTDGQGHDRADRNG